MDATAALPLADLDAIARAELAASGELRATELLEAAIERLEGARELNAVIPDLFDRGREQGAALDASRELRGGESGPLARAGGHGLTRVATRRSCCRAAPRHSAATISGTDRDQGFSSHVMFMARGKIGPVMYDEGAGDRIITVGSYLLRSA